MAGENGDSDEAGDASGGQASDKCSLSPELLEWDGRERRCGELDQRGQGLGEVDGGSDVADVEVEAVEDKVGGEPGKDRGQGDEDEGVVGHGCP